MQDNDIDTGEDQGSTTDDSAVIRALRKQINDLEKQAKATPDRATVEAEVRAELARNNAIAARLVSHNIPVGILDSVINKLGDAEVSPENVDKALVSIGFSVEGTDAGSDQPDQTNQQLGNLAGVASLSAQVQSAAGGGAPATAVEEINLAKNQAELIEAARKGGFLAG